MVQNVRGAERWLSIGGGGALAAWGMRRGGGLGVAAGIVGAGLLARGLSSYCPVKQTLSGDQRDQRVAAMHGWSSAAVETRAVTINAPRQEIYEFWRDFSNLSQVMEDADIKVLDDKRTHWTVQGPLGAKVEWEAIITDDQPGRRIAWEAAPQSGLSNAGWVEFCDAPGGRGAEVRAFLAYEPPGGQIGRIAAKALRKEPGIQVRRELRRLKQLLETGEIATSKPPEAAPRAS